MKDTNSKNLIKYSGGIVGQMVRITMALVLLILICIGCKEPIASGPVVPSASSDVNPVNTTDVKVTEQNNPQSKSNASSETWKVSVGGHHYLAKVSYRGNDLIVELNENGNKEILSSESYGVPSTLRVIQLTGDKDEQNILITSDSGGSGGDILYSVVGFNKKSNRPELAETPFSTLNHTALYEISSKAKDESFKNWVNNQYQGFRNARFQNFNVTLGSIGSVNFDIGYKPTLALGKATVQFNFNTLQFGLKSIDFAQMRNALKEPECEGVKPYKDGVLGDILTIRSEGNSYRTAEGKVSDMNTLVACGESLDKQLEGGTYYLIQALTQYQQNSELTKEMLALGANPHIKDRFQNSTYSIALANKVSDPEILSQLRTGMSQEEVKREEMAVKVTLHGSTLSIKELQSIFDTYHIPINRNMAEYSGSSDNEAKPGPDYMTGTILGSAVKNEDSEKLTWLLGQGADPNMHFGTGEFDISPIRYALTNDLQIAEILLEHGVNLEELVSTYPGYESLLAQFACDSQRVTLLKKYGANRWFIDDTEKGKKYTTEEEVMSVCHKP